ncbi:MAG: HIT family protein [Nitrososphaerota archaeon]|nr:HIT family protein [Nitrososphaerota archaeon]MDG6939763.1 HIT family protein [Nitrososphaerota archaeon]
MTEDCIFCKIAKGEATASVVYEDRDVIAFLDINPLEEGHTLVIPKKHFVDIWDIDPDTLARVTAVTKQVAHKMAEVLDAQGINTFSASGKPAGQDVFHFHMHVIPLAAGGRTKFSEWWRSSMRRAERPELESLAEKLSL